MHRKYRFYPYQSKHAKMNLPSNMIYTSFRPISIDPSPFCWPLRRVCPTVRLRKGAPSVCAFRTMPWHGLSWYCLDAILRTLWREWISHRHLLQWNPSHEAERTAAGTLSGLYSLMWICPALAAVLAALLTRHGAAPVSYTHLTTGPAGRYASTFS